jgi:hypothetical protein
MGDYALRLERLGSGASHAITVAIGQCAADGSPTAYTIDCKRFACAEGESETVFTNRVRAAFGPQRPLILLGETDARL